LHLDCGRAIAQQCWSPTEMLASHGHRDRNMGQSSLRKPAQSFEQRITY
jgi:hypothetical protein